DHALLHSGKGLARDADPGDFGLRRKIALDGLRIRRLDLRLVDEARERFAGGAIARGRRRPVELRRGAAAAAYRIGKTGDAEVQHRELLCEQCAHATSLAASSAARALLDSSSMPASRSAASWRARPCGSSSVPQTKPTTASARLCLRAISCALRIAGAISPAGSACAP